MKEKRLLLILSTCCLYMANRRVRYGACAEAETGEAGAAPAHLGAGGRGGGGKRCGRGGGAA